MNIFATTSDPAACAAALDNKRLVKMVLESAQLLSTAITVNGGVGPYKVTHVNHPCSVWARSSRSNYLWLLEHFKSLCSEYTFRYGKVHKCELLLPQFISNLHLMPEADLTAFANCTEFKHIADVHAAYRQQMISKWRRDKAPRWTNRNKPDWADI